MTATTLFSAALEAYREISAAEGPAAMLLAQLGYGGGDAGDLRRFREGVLGLAAAADEIFMLNRPGPGEVHLLGLRLRTAGHGLADAADEVVFAGGRGMDFRAAFESCVGEAFERLCLQGREAPSRDPAGGETVIGHRLVDGTAVAVPADAVLRRASAVRRGNPLPGSAGCGTAATLAAAVRSGIMELIERDAVALWWLGGRSGLPATPAACAALDDLRPRGSIRPAWLLDLTTDLGVPVFAALSSDQAGAGVVTAAAAGTDAVAAARRAAMELVQMEHAADLSQARQRAGMPLSAGDRLWLDRLEALNTSDFPILLPSVGRAARHDAEPLAAMRRADPDACAIDISIHGFGMRAARVIASRLQACGTDAVTTRLQQALDESGHCYAKHRRAPQPI